MLRIPSLESIGTEIAGVARRFPLVCVVLVMVAVTGQLVIDAWERDAGRLLAAGSFGVPALVATALWRETRQGARWTWILDALVLALLGLFAWSWPHWSDELAWRRLLHANLAGLLAVAVMPFVGRGWREVFWPFDRTLFVRFVVASIFAAVLFAGLGLAIASVETLFGLEIDDEIYPRLFVALVTVFHPLYVLSGVPRDLPALRDDRDFPRPLRVFAQSILLPLVAVYLVILLAYLGRVVLTQEWPSGWIGWLVSAVAVAGLLAVVLLDPVARERGGGWVPRVTFGWFAAMIPSLVMLLMALGKRVDQYGITENRYFLGVLAIWLLVLCLARVARTWRDPRWIPGTLAVVTLLTIAGPWGAYAVARHSQTERLMDLLDRVDRLEDGRAVASATSVPDSIASEIGATVRYLARTHGVESLEPVFVDARDSLRAVDARGAHEVVARALESIDVPVVVPSAPGGGTWFDLGVTGHSEPLAVTGYDYAWRVEVFGGRAQTLELRESSLRVRLDGSRLVATWAEADTAFVLALDEAIAAARRSLRASAPAREAAPVTISAGPARLLVTGLGGTEGDGEPVVETLSGLLLLRAP